MLICMFCNQVFCNKHGLELQTKSTGSFQFHHMTEITNQKDIIKPCVVCGITEYDRQ